MLGSNEVLHMQNKVGSGNHVLPMAQPIHSVNGILFEYG